jgi:hypothetical protein
MKTDRLGKFLLAVIAVLLVQIAVQNLRKPIEPVHAAAPTRQAWEYKFIQRTFRFERGSASGTSSWSEDGKSLAVDEDDSSPLIQKFSDLGSQGWELVTDTPFSLSGRMYPKIEASANGVTTAEKWTFKRPKQ